MKMAESDALLEQTLALPLEFRKSSADNLTNSNLHDLWVKLDAISDENEIKRIITEIVNVYKSSKDTIEAEARKILISFFTKYNNKKHLKKFTYDLLIKQHLANRMVIQSAHGILDKVKKELTFNLRECNEFLHFIAVLQTFQKFDFEDNFDALMPLYLSLLDSFGRYAEKLKAGMLPAIDELNTLIHLIVKQILPVFTKGSEFLQRIKERLKTLTVYLYVLLFNDKLEFDLRMKISLLLVHSSKLFEHVTVAKLINKNGVTDHLCVNENPNTYVPHDYSIIIYSAIIRVLPEEKLLSHEINGRALITILYEDILETSQTYSDDITILIESSKILSLIVFKLKAMPCEVVRPLFIKGLYYVLYHIDHFIDTVRHYTKLFFQELIALAAHHHVGDNFLEVNGDLTDILLDELEKISEENTMRLLAYEYIARNYGFEFLMLKFLHLPIRLLAYIGNITIMDQVSDTYQILVEKSFPTSLNELRINAWVETWIIPVVNVLRSGKESQKFCQRIISTAFNLHPALLRKLFPNEYVGTLEESKVLLHCLHNARKNGIELTIDTDFQLYWRGLIDKQKMEMFMIHQNEEIRLLVLAAITDTLKSTELFLDWEFMFLINFIRYNITAQAANVRSQIITYYKKALARYEAGYKVIIRNIGNFTKSLSLSVTHQQSRKNYLLLYQQLQNSYQKFMNTFTAVLVANLSYDSNYSRRVVSLELLFVIKQILTEDEWKNSWSKEDVRNSHNIIFDSYESNKEMVVALLKTLPAQYLGFLDKNFTTKYLKRSFELAYNVKPSKTLSAAYLFEICTYSPFFYNSIKDDIQDKNIIEINSDNPTLNMIVLLLKKLLSKKNEINIDYTSMSHSSVYGLILSIRHLLQKRNINEHNDMYSVIFDHLVNCCINISEKLKPIISNPSPEGYLLDEDDIGSDEFSKAQLLSVYVWRAMKETMSLLKEIAIQTFKLQNVTKMLSEKLLCDIGNFFMRLFLESKHRGVFEQAYADFSVVCECYRRSINSVISDLPKMWLQKTMDICTGRVHSKDLTATRRSAGLPFLILSILSNDTNSSFIEQMNVLFEVAEHYEKYHCEIRIHCLNTLRALFRHSKLGELAAPYVGRGTIVSIMALHSDVWGIRNSGALLFATMIIRIFGVQRTQDWDKMHTKTLTVKVFFMRYKVLHNFIIKKLASECENASSTILQPILSILSRLQPSIYEEDFSEVSAYMPLLNQCLKNPSYRTREAAAKASVALISHKNIKEHLDEAFHKLKKHDINNNECHGILLQLFYIIKHNEIRGLPISIYLEDSAHILSKEFKKFSHMTMTLYMELVTEILYICTEYDDLNWLKKILLCLSQDIKSFEIPLLSYCNYCSARAILAYYIIIQKLEETDVTYSVVSNDIMAFLYGRVHVMKRFCLELLICLNQTHILNIKLDPTFSSVPKKDSHALFLTGDVEIRNSVYDFVNALNKSSIEKILKHIHPYIKRFLVEEIEIQHYIHRQDKVLLFLLLDYYPCIINFLRLSKQETLNCLLAYCSCDNEELISAVIGCIGTFFMEVDFNLLSYDKLLDVLSDSAAPNAALHRRLTVCEFLCKNYDLYCNEEPILQGDQLCRILNIVMVLLEDESLEVRNAMSGYENELNIKIKINGFINQMISGNKWPVVPEKAKEDLIYLMTVLLPQDKAVCTIFSWACRYFPAINHESLQIFERGETNQYAENTPLVDICSRMLIKMLWVLPEGVSLEDRSILIEEQTWAVTNILLNSFTKYSSPMMLKKTKTSIICALKSLHRFLENMEVSDNFQAEFKKYFQNNIMYYFNKSLENGDLFCVKNVMNKLYEPVYWMSNVKLKSSPSSNKN